MNPARAYAADRIYDGDRVLDDHAIVVKDQSISRVLPVAELPNDLPVDRHPGCTIIPGLIDTHMHFMRWQGPIFLAYGVTCRPRYRQRHGMDPPVPRQVAATDLAAYPQPWPSHRRHTAGPLAGRSCRYRYRLSRRSRS